MLDETVHARVLSKIKTATGLETDECLKKHWHAHTREMLELSNVRGRQTGCECFIQFPDFQRYVHGHYYMPANVIIQPMGQSLLSRIFCTFIYSDWSIFQFF